MVGGVEIPPVQGTFRAFEAGARSVNPEIEVLEAFTGNWDDVGAAKEAAVAQLTRGADVLIHNVDAAALGVFNAVREVVAAGGTAWALGMNSDQNHIAPGVIVGSAVIRIPLSFLETALAWQAGEIGGEPIYAGANERVIDFVLNPELADLLSPDFVRSMDDARARIRDGSLRVPSVAFVEGETGGS
jgi:basic membrane lipoprotein Med (substrate-binding protein (PBP1-ABC) superfamily)